MIQRRVSGVTLHEYLGKIEMDTRELTDIENQYTAQQDAIGYFHTDINDKNIMVDAETGTFKTFIDWDQATPMWI